MDATTPNQLARWTRWAAWIGLLLCAPLLFLDWPIHHDPEYHPHFPVQTWFGFFPALSALSCAILALTAKVCQGLCRRSEDYYDE